MGGDFGGVGDQWEGGQDVGECGLGQAVEVGDQAVQFGAEFCMATGLGGREGPSFTALDDADGVEGLEFVERDAKRVVSVVQGQGGETE